MKPNNFFSAVGMGFMFHSGLGIGSKHNLYGGIMFGIAIVMWIFSVCLEKQIKSKEVMGE